MPHTEEKADRDDGKKTDHVKTIRFRSELPESKVPSFDGALDHGSMSPSSWPVSVLP